VEFNLWGINVFLGCLFGIEVYHQRYLHDSMMHKRLCSWALYAFLTFSLISFVVLSHEMISEKMNDSFYPIIGSGFVPPVMCSVGVMLLYFGYTLSLKKLNR
jgi:hypothetical protein